MHVVAGLALDVPDGFLSYGAIGAWVVTVSWLGLRARLLPVALCAVGFAAGLSYLAGLLGYLLLERWLLVVSIGVGGIFVAPLWYAWLGLILQRTRPSSRARASSAS